MVVKMVSPCTLARSFVIFSETCGGFCTNSFKKRFTFMNSGSISHVSASDTNSIVNAPLTFSLKIRFDMVYIVKERQLDYFPQGVSIYVYSLYLYLRAWSDQSFHSQIKIEEHLKTPEPVNGS